MVIAVGAHSGIAGIAAWINTFFNLKDEKKINKKDVRILEIKKLPMTFIGLLYHVTKSY